jgi:hypothetical protein
MYGKYARFYRMSADTSCFEQLTAIPNVRMEESAFALENADVLLDLEENIVIKVLI